MRTLTCIAGILVVAHSSQAADLEAGKRMASTVCAACHGATGISVSDTIPNLAGILQGWQAEQLKTEVVATQPEAVD
jgi:cytochrome c553